MSARHVAAAACAMVTDDSQYLHCYSSVFAYVRQAATPAALAAPKSMLLVGTHAYPSSFYTVGVLHDNSLEALAAAGAADAPAFFCIHSGVVYAVNSVAGDGFVSAYTLGADYKTKRLNFMSSGGNEPAYLSLDRRGSHVLVANYSNAGNGSVSVYAIDGGTGALGACTCLLNFPAPSHAHCILTDPSDEYALVADLGANCVYVFLYDAGAGVIDPKPTAIIPFPLNAGPRHIVFSDNPTLPLCFYVICQGSNEIYAYDWPAFDTGPFQITSTQPGPDVSNAAEILYYTAPTGESYVFASNRCPAPGVSTIVTFSVYSAGKLCAKQIISSGGNVAWNMAFDKATSALAVTNTDTNNLVLFTFSRETLLKQVSETGPFPSAPFGVQFIPAA